MQLMRIFIVVGFFLFHGHCVRGGQQPTRSTNGWNIQRCASETQRELLAALFETQTMFARAWERLNTLQRILANDEVPDPSTWEPMDASTLRTYQNLIEPTLAMSGGLRDRARQVSRVFLKFVTKRMENVAEYLHRQRELEVWCNDTFLRDLRYPRPGVRFYDSRPGATVDGRVQVFRNIRPFWTRPGKILPIAKSYVESNAGDPTIVINPNFLASIPPPGMRSLDGDDPSFTQIRNMRLRREEMHMMNFKQNDHLSMIFLWDLPFFLRVSGGERGDFRTQPFVQSQDLDPHFQVDRWTASIRRARARQDWAIDHPTNNMYLAMALYLDNYDWSLGFNRELDEALRW